MTTYTAEKVSSVILQFNPLGWRDGVGLLGVWVFRGWFLLWRFFGLVWSGFGGFVNWLHWILYDLEKKKSSPMASWGCRRISLCLAIFLFCRISCKQVGVTLSLEVVGYCRDLRDGRDYAWGGERSQRGWEGHGIALLSTWSSTLHYPLKLYFLQLNLTQVRDTVGLRQLEAKESLKSCVGWHEEVFWNSGQIQSLCSK